MATLPPEQLQYIEDKDLTQQSFSPYLNHQYRLTTPLIMVSFNTISLNMSPPQELIDKIKQPNVAITIVDTRMMEDKMAIYKKQVTRVDQKWVIDNFHLRDNPTLDNNPEVKEKLVKVL